MATVLSPLVSEKGVGRSRSTQRLKEGLQTQIARSYIVLTAVACGIVGAALAGSAAFAIPDRFVSTGVMRIRPLDSRPTSDARFNVMLTAPFLIGDVEFGGILSTLEHADASLEPLTSNVPRPARVRVSFGRWRPC